MSFLKVFNSCCPFLIAPAMDAEDEYVDNMKDFDEKFDFELNDLADEHNKKYQQQRLDAYARCTVVNHVSNARSSCCANSLNNSSSNNIVAELDTMQENVSNMVVNDILNKIVY